MAGMSKTNRSIDRGHADRVLAHHAVENGRSPHFFHPQRPEPVVEVQHPQIGQHCSWTKAVAANYAAAATSAPLPTTSPSLFWRVATWSRVCPAAIAILASRASSQKPEVFPSNAVVAALTNTPQLSPTSNIGRMLIG